MKHNAINKQLNFQAPFIRELHQIELLTTYGGGKNQSFLGIAFLLLGAFLVANFCTSQTDPNAKRNQYLVAGGLLALGAGGLLLISNEKDVAVNPIMKAH